MATIVVQTEINSTIEKAWNIISDIDNEPKFWKGTKAVKTLSVEGGIISREITIAFRDQKCLQEIQLIPKSSSIKGFNFWHTASKFDVLLNFKGL